MSNLPKDLYMQREDWVTDPILAYKSLMANQTLVKPNSQKIYVYMWSKFCRWMEKELIRIDRCDANHFQTFMDKGNFTPLYQRRYAQICDTVWKHMNRIGMNVRNPAWRYLEKGKKEEEGNKTAFLEPEEIERFENLLDQIFSTPILLKEGHAWDWVRIRDASIAALMIGGGVALREAVKLPVSGAIPKGEALPLPFEGSEEKSFNTGVPEKHSVSGAIEGAAAAVKESLTTQAEGGAEEKTFNTPRAPEGGTVISGGKLRIPDIGTQTGRSAHLFDIGLRAMRIWPLWRKELPDAQRNLYLFPAKSRMRRGQDAAAGTKTTITPAANPDTISGAIDKLLKEAGIDREGVGAQALRNTYAARLFEMGMKDDVDVAYNMGLRLAGSATRLRTAWEKPKKQSAAAGQGSGQVGDILDSLSLPGNLKEGTQPSTQKDNS